MKQIKLEGIPVVTGEWIKRFDERIRNDPKFKADRVESLARLIAEESKCVYDGPDQVSTGQRVTKWTARECETR